MVKMNIWRSERREFTWQKIFYSPYVAFVFKIYFALGIFSGIFFFVALVVFGQPLHYSGGSDIDGLLYKTIFICAGPGSFILISYLYMKFRKKYLDSLPKSKIQSRLKEERDWAE